MCINKINWTRDLIKTDNKTKQFYTKTFHCPSFVVVCLINLVIKTKCFLFLFFFHFPGKKKHFQSACPVIYTPHSEFSCSPFSLSVVLVVICSFGESYLHFCGGCEWVYWVLLYLLALVYMPVVLRMNLTVHASDHFLILRLLAT